MKNLLKIPSNERKRETSRSPPFSEKTQKPTYLKFDAMSEENFLIHNKFNIQTSMQW